MTRRTIIVLFAVFVLILGAFIAVFVVNSSRAETISCPRVTYDPKNLPTNATVNRGVYFDENTKQHYTIKAGKCVVYQQ